VLTVEEIETRLRASRRRDELWGAPWYASPAEAAALTSLAHDLWRRAFGTPWPPGWTIAYGDLEKRRAPDGVDACARCFYRRKKILISWRYHHARPGELPLTVLHELVHIRHPRDGHGQRFQAELHRARQACRVTRRPPMKTRRTDDDALLAKLRSPLIERASLGAPRSVAAAAMLAIRRTIDEQERRRPGSTAGLTWTTRRVGDELVGWPVEKRRAAPAPRRGGLSVAAAGARTSRHRL
jgi:Protein of unknown function DUF45